MKVCTKYMKSAVQESGHGKGGSMSSFIIFRIKPGTTKNLPASLLVLLCSMKWGFRRARVRLPYLTNARVPVQTPVQSAPAV